MSFLERTREQNEYHRFIHLSLSAELIREIRLMKFARSSDFEHDIRFNVLDVNESLRDVTSSAILSSTLANKKSDTVTRFEFII